jgi:hypothetical protein
MTPLSHSHAANMNTGATGAITATNDIAYGDTYKDIRIIPTITNSSIRTAITFFMI